MTTQSPKPDISVIVPIYNCASFLDQCMESICIQNLQNIEVILVDDASVDNSATLIDCWAKRDKRIRTFRQHENQGVSAARNLALDHAQGEYVIFVDADDYWSGKHMLADLYQQIQTDRADLLRFGFRKLGDNDKVLYTKTDELYKLVDLTTDNNWNVSYSTWAHLIRRELIEINKLRFEPGLSMGEDALFNYGLYCNATRLSISNKTYYNYRRNPDSANRSHWSPHKLNCTVWWFELAIHSIKHSPAYSHRPDLLQRLCMERLNTLNNNLCRLALETFSEIQLKEFIQRWAHCLAELKDVPSLPQHQHLQSLLTILNQHNTASFRKYVESALAEITLNRTQAVQLGRLLLDQKTKQITLHLGCGRWLSLPKTEAHSLARKLLSTDLDPYVLKL